jgi:3,4-dihydroxy 2-butanone 4-phosphate synthase / GTP cyclohydrolase II
VSFDSIESGLAAFARGEHVVVVDDEDRENEGDLIQAAQHVSVESIAFMVRHTSGLLCVGMTGERLDALELPLMVARNSESMRTAFTVSVDVLAGTTTGISAADRAATIRALADPGSCPSDFARPGHVFPLRAQPGGVLARRGHTEAAVDLARLSGLCPAGVLSEVANVDGSMARRPQLEQFAAEHNLRMIAIADLVRYRQAREGRLETVATAALPTRFGAFQAFAFEARGQGAQHLALVRGDIADGRPVLVRVHSECLSGDVFRSRGCDCGEHLVASMEAISETARGVVVYLRGREGDPVGEYAAAADILRGLHVDRVRLLTNNPRKCAALAACGLDVVERVPLLNLATADNVRYLHTRQERLGHLLELS